ncbi:MAG: soluble lytic murein transglycosylase [Granulosicoccus sp.]|jgi:soluble lytic murein transglycosylase
MVANLRSSLPIPALISTILLSSLISTHAIATDTAKIDILENSQDKHAKERILYIEAKKAFDNKDPQGYQALKSQLTTYPLYPYLSYAELSRTLDSRRKAARISKYGVSATSNRDKKAITQFITQHNKSYLGDRLRSKWLDYLAEQKNWPDYKRYYQDSVKKTELKCFHLQAQLHTGEPLDVTAVDQLWLSNRSQPNACNPIFAEWKKQGHLTPSKLWQRYTLAVDKSNTSLAKYVQKNMSASDSYLADLYLKVHKSPQTVKEVKSRTRKALSHDIASQHIIDIIEHGLYRYAYRQPEETYRLYKQFKKTYAFSEQASTRLNQRIAKQLISQDNIALASTLLKQMTSEDRADQVEYLLRKLLAKQAWSGVYYWISQLPEERINSDRWQYWIARSLESLPASYADHDSTILSPAKTYRQLAGSRSFYGFLAADKQQTVYQFEDKPAPVNQTLIRELSSSTAVKRAKEFFLMGKMHRARTEWSYAVAGISTEEFIAAAQIAHQWGWNRKAIEAMAGAVYWDDLRIRFPVVHQEIIHNAADKHDIPSSLVFSIARQESAWEFDATSRVGARGLMQLMPATAKQTAKKARLAYKKSKLFEPQYNIALGSHYITGLLEQYDDNRALAIASYNAGPHRVKQWLKKTNASLPLDVWVEIIPFKETRKYVQNVLSYEVIYNYRQGRESSLLTLAEANSTL